MDLSVIIVNWNSREYLRKCVASIVAQTHGLEYEIIVIDSASYDGSDQMLRDEYPQVRFIQSRENLGFARANNQAYAISRGEYLLFLNPDTEVVGPAINVLHSALKCLPDAGAVGGKLLNTDGTLQTSCVQAFPSILNQLLNVEAFRRLTPRARLWGMRAVFESNGKPSKVEMISGACLMMRRSVFERVGRFSPDYFMYAEDVDLCYKARQAGFTNYYLGDAVVVHHGGGSSQQARSNFSNIMMCDSVWRLFKKTRGRLYGLAYRVAMLVSAVVRLAVLVVLFPAVQARRHRQAWRAAIRKWNAVMAWSLRGRGDRSMATQPISHKESPVNLT
ncbi:MAG: glycosyltransferase family 2 protein [Verrucomicrobia bacterium]|nr:glycosyltransferase family 2 protein [Verrucomicrobiota bacterium]